MNSKIIIPVLFILLVFFSGCTGITGSTVGIRNCVTGSGDIISETRDVKDFDSLRLMSSGDIHLTQTDESGIKIEADDNVMPLINTEVENDVLIISREPSTCTISEEVKIYLNMKDIEQLSILGSGEIIGENEIESETLGLSISEAGEMSLNIDVDTLSTTISGSGEYNLEGNADEHEATITESGTLNAYELITDKTTVTISGYGEAYVYASENLNTYISGNSKVKNRYNS